jgi:hypothetical protein
MLIYELWADLSSRMIHFLAYQQWPWNKRLRFLTADLYLYADCLSPDVKGFASGLIACWDKMLFTVISQHAVRSLGFLSQVQHKRVLLIIRDLVLSSEPKPKYVYGDANWDHFKHCVTNKWNINLLPDNNTIFTKTDKAVTHLADTITPARKSLHPSGPETSSLHT